MKTRPTALRRDAIFRRIAPWLGHAVAEKQGVRI